jgi:hypothetical protein
MDYIAEQALATQYLLIRVTEAGRRALRQPPVCFCRQAGLAGRARNAGGSSADADDALVTELVVLAFLT